MHILMHTLRKNLGAAGLSLLALAPASAQSPCTELNVEHLQYDAFNPAALELVVNNQSSEIFSYPSFMLVGTQGDTLAREQVSFFGIGTGPQAHYMVAEPGVTFPTSPFDATLLLYGGFGDTLYCSWDLTDIALCPSDTCIQAEIYLTNTGTLMEFFAYYWVTDTDLGAPVANGFVEMDEISSTHFDTLCLPPGNYLLEFSPFSPIDTNYIVGISTSYMFSLGTNTAQQQDPTPLDLAFSWYEACIGISNGLAEQGSSDLVMVIDHDQLRLTDPEGAALGDITLWSSDGRLIAARSTNANTAELSMHDLAPGILLARVVGPNGTLFTQRIFNP